MKSLLLKSVSALLLPALFSLPVLTSAGEKQAEHNAKDSSAQKSEAKWSYDGATGPAHWGDLAAENITCKQGKNQSPVDINRTFDARLPSIKFDYSVLNSENIVNTGHSIQVNIRSGGLIKLDGKDFLLKQFHFHSPSENMVDSQSFPLEAHFVHVSEDNELAVVALLYQPGPPDAALDVLIKNMPMNPGDTNRLGAKDIEFFERSKKIKDYFRFNGSLTTPPCTEGVRWIVLHKKPTLTRGQLSAFQKALKHPNNRPIQPVNARTILR